MAKQSGILQLSGTLGGITFFENGGGFYARTKSSLDRKRVLTDPQFERTRENSNEFGEASRGYSLLRHAFLPDMRIYRGQNHRKLFLRLMLALKDLDTVHPRGQRTVSQGLPAPGATELFKGLNFNSKMPLDSLLFRRPTVDMATGEVRITGFVPSDYLNYPASATHVQLTAYRSDLNFTTQTFRTVKESSSVLAIDDAVHDLVLTPTGPSLPADVRLFVLQVRFFQEMNGKLYPLKREDMGAMGVVGSVQLTPQQIV